MKWTIFALLMAIAIGSCSTSNSLQSKKELAETERVIASLTSQKRLKFDVIMAYPMGGNAIPVTSDFTLELSGDSVISHLPYFGRAYSAPLTDGNAFDFVAPLTDYKVGTAKNGAVVVTFGAKTIEDTFRYRIEVFGNGRAYIKVATQKRQPISYDGEVAL